MCACVLRRKSLAEKQAEKERFDKFLEAFGIDKRAGTSPEFYRGSILREHEILDKFVKLEMINDNFVGRMLGKTSIFCRKFKDPGCYYSTYYFELVDTDRWQLRWFDRIGP